MNKGNLHDYAPRLAQQHRIPLVGSHG
jgi:hypothetical protein